MFFIFREIHITLSNGSLSRQAKISLGALLLLLKKKIASTFFILSFIGIIIQMTYGLLISENTNGYGPLGLIMPLMIIVIGGYLIWYSKKAAEHRWLS